jgi:hypothetical protein
VIRPLRSRRRETSATFHFPVIDLPVKTPKSMGEQWMAERFRLTFLEGAQSFEKQKCQYVFSGTLICSNRTLTFTKTVRSADPRISVRLALISVQKQLAETP